MDKDSEAETKDKKNGSSDECAKKHQRASSVPKKETKRIEIAALVFAGLAALISSWQACIARSAANDVAHSLLLHDRPYLTVTATRATGFVPAAKGCIVNVEVKNVGTLPAQKVETATFTRWHDKSDFDLGSTRPKTPVRSVSLVGSGELMQEFPEIQCLNDAQTQLMKEGKLTGFVWGQIEYRGPEGDAYVTYFCERWNPKGVFENCENYNDLN